MAATSAAGFIMLTIRISYDHYVTLIYLLQSMISYWNIKKRFIPYKQYAFIDNKKELLRKCILHNPVF